MEGKMLLLNKKSQYFHYSECTPVEQKQHKKQEKHKWRLLLVKIQNWVISIIWMMPALHLEGVKNGRI